MCPRRLLFLLTEVLAFSLHSAGQPSVESLTEICSGPADSRVAPLGASLQRSQLCANSIRSSLTLQCSCSAQELEPLLSFKGQCASSLSISVPFASLFPEVSAWEFHGPFLCLCTCAGGSWNYLAWYVMYVLFLEQVVLLPR